MSSYEKNNYDILFEALILLYKPKLTVELGVLNGFSLFAMASRAKEYGGKVVGIDLFEDYKYKKAYFNDIVKKRDSLGLSQIVDLIKENAFVASDLFAQNSIDLLHIDISNDGDKLLKIFKLWGNKVKANGYVIFEGGSIDRDEVEWMIEFNKTPINKFKRSLYFNRHFEYVTLMPHPSMTICRRKANFE